MVRRGRKRKWRDPATTSVKLEKDEYILLSALLDESGKNFSDIFRMGSRAYLDEKFSAGEMSPELLPLYHRVLSIDISEVRSGMPADAEVIEKTEIAERVEIIKQVSEEDKMSDEILPAIMEDMSTSDITRYRDWFRRAQVMRSSRSELSTIAEAMTDFRRNYPDIASRLREVVVDPEREPYVFRLAIAQAEFELTSSEEAI